MTPKILIVKDEMQVALELESILAESGFESVGIAPDLCTAQDYAGHPIDLALVDLNLRDGLTGPQVGKLLCEKGVSVLFLTANPSVLGEGIAGTIGVLTKPTDIETVKCAVDYALGVRKGVAVEPPPALKLFGLSLAGDPFALDDDRCRKALGAPVANECPAQLVDDA